MPDEIRYIPLYGRVVTTGRLLADTGLRIGGNPSGIDIGGIDNIVLRNPVSQLPYVPGSSLKGKMRSLYERYTGAVINHPIDQVWIHSSPGSTEIWTSPAATGNTVTTMTAAKRMALMARRSLSWLNMVPP